MCHLMLISRRTKVPTLPMPSRTRSTGNPECSSSVYSVVYAGFPAGQEVAGLASRVLKKCQKRGQGLKKQCLRVASSTAGVGRSMCNSCWFHVPSCSTKGKEMPDWFPQCSTRIFNSSRLHSLEQTFKVENLLFVEENGLPMSSKGPCYPLPC